MSEQKPRRVWLWLVVWSVVFAGNLILPLQLSEAILSERAGMGLAILLWWVTGLLAGAISDGMRVALVTGGVAIGLLQLAVFPQAIAGGIAIRAWEEIAGPIAHKGHAPHLSAVGGFVVTTITGGFLMLGALVIGSGLVWLKRSYDPAEESRRASPQPSA